MMERPRNGKTNVIKFSEKVKEEYNILLGIERIYKTPLHTLKIFHSIIIQKIGFERGDWRGLEILDWRENWIEERWYLLVGGSERNFTENNKITEHRMKS